MKIKRATYRHIEAEIYNYHDTLRAINALREEIINASRREEFGMAISSGYTSSPTERRATRLADSILLREMERITGAIRDTYVVAKEEARKVVWVKYGLAIGWEPPAELVAQMDGVNRFDISGDDMADTLEVERTTFYRYRSGFVYGVAEKLGWY